MENYMGESKLLYQFSQVEIAFSASTRCLCVFILPAGRHAMLLQCANLYAWTGHSNRKYNSKYNFVGHGSLIDILWQFEKVKHDVTTQLSIIIIHLLNSNFACNVYEYFKDCRSKSTCESQNAPCGTQSDI